MNELEKESKSDGNIETQRITIFLRITWDHSYSRRRVWNERTFDS